MRRRHHVAQESTDAAAIRLRAPPDDERGREQSGRGQIQRAVHESDASGPAIRVAPIGDARDSRCDGAGDAHRHGRARSPRELITPGRQAGRVERDGCSPGAQRNIGCVMTSIT